MKILENLWHSSETLGNLRKQFKSVFHCIYEFLKFSENLRKSSDAFRNLWKFSENFRNDSNVIFRCFYFLKFLENLQKCSEIFGNFWKTLETVQK